MYRVGGNRYIRSSEKYLHYRLEGDIDWIDVALDAGGIAADIVSFGVGGRVINGVQVGRKARQVGNTLNKASAAYAVGQAGYHAATDSLTVDDGKSLTYSAVGLFVPGVGTVADAVSLFDNLFRVSP